MLTASFERKSVKQRVSFVIFFYYKHIYTLKSPPPQCLTYKNITCKNINYYIQTLVDSRLILQNVTCKVLGVNVIFFFFRCRSLLENQRVQGQRVAKAPREKRLVRGVKLLELRLKTRLQIHVERRRGGVRVSGGGKVLGG